MNSKVVRYYVLGFLLLSVVIGLIIASYDPLEQVKKEQDNRLQTDAAEFIQATVQYYSSQGGLPWFGTDDNGVHCFEDSNELQTLALTDLHDCVKVLENETTLRRDFLSSTNARYLMITNPNPQTGNKLDTVVCFQPQSKALQMDVNTHYSQNGTNAPANRCYSQGGSEYCYWCTQ